MNPMTYTKNGLTYHITSAKLNYYTPDEVVEMMWRSRVEQAFWERVAARLTKEEKDKILRDAETDVRAEREKKERDRAEMLIGEPV